MDGEEEAALIAAAQTGDADAVKRLVVANMRLVVNIAATYRSRLPLGELVEHGTSGLLHALDRFDPDKGFRFSTYATHWVREAIGRAIDENRE